MSDRYELTGAQRDAFGRDGWAHLPGFVTGAALDEIEAACWRLLRREVRVTGRDYCDMSGDYGRPVEQYEILNVMLPRRYLPSLAGNVYERRAAHVSAQIWGEDMELDYDQVVAKPPQKPGAVFHWHQDLAYWPDLPDTRTASFWLALDDVDLDNGCLQFVQGSHREPRLRPHLPFHGDRERSHVLAARVDERCDVLVPARLRRGDATVHHERALHGSGGNESSRWRRGYVVAFRSRATVAAERAMGFTHSHNDPPEVLAGIAASARASTR